MTHQDFFHRLAAQYAMRLPFVAYRKPGSNKVQVIFQNDSTLHKIDDNQSGFIFAPFQKEGDILFIPGSSKSATIDQQSISTAHVDHLNSQDKDKKSYIALVEKAVEAIKTTALEKVVLSRKQSFKNTMEPIGLFKQLLTQYPDAFTYLWFHPKVGLWIGATPETLLEVSGLGFKTMALAGTQEYNGENTPDWEPKELREQQYVVNEIKSQLEAFDLKKHSIAERKTIKAGNLLHLQTRISGILKSRDQIMDLVYNLHPTPAVCGFPRAEAQEFIAQYEAYDREYYSGFLGEINQQQEQNRAKHRKNVENLAYKSLKRISNLYVNLRCMKYEDQQVALYMGGGITADSNPEKEWEETCAKAQTMLQVLQKD